MTVTNDRSAWLLLSRVKQTLGFKWPHPAPVTTRRKDEPKRFKGLKRVINNVWYPLIIYLALSFLAVTFCVKCLKKVHRGFHPSCILSLCPPTHYLARINPSLIFSPCASSSRYWEASDGREAGRTGNLAGRPGLHPQWLAGVRPQGWGNLLHLTRFGHQPSTATTAAAATIKTYDTVTFD